MNLSSTKTDDTNYIHKHYLQNSFVFDGEVNHNEWNGCFYNESNINLEGEHKLLLPNIGEISGSFKKGILNCGVIKFMEENQISYYSGELVNCVPNGKGMLVFKNGASWNGKVVRSKAYGKGHFEADHIFFEGIFLLNQPVSGVFTSNEGAPLNGLFKINLPNSKFEGYLSDGLFSAGTIEFENYTTYSGSFAKSFYPLTGQIIYPSGAVFTGKFQDGVSHEGLLVLSNGDCFAGKVINEYPSGVGSYTFADSSQCQCDFGNAVSFWQFKTSKNNLISGKLLFNSPLLGNFDGYAADGELTFGKLVHGKNQYCGALQDGQPHGHGHLRLESGVEYEGHFTQGCLIGLGEMKFANSDIYKGEFGYVNKAVSGAYTCAAEQVTFRGRFCNGQPEIGVFEDKNGLINGKITLRMVKMKGSEYVEVGLFNGDFYEGKIIEGEIMYPNETSYKGKFINNYPETQYNVAPKSGGFMREEKYICAGMLGLVAIIILTALVKGAMLRK